MVAARVRLLLVTLWVGSMWAIGYIVAPTLFATLADRVLAGFIAGKLFRIEAWVSVVCAIALIAMVLRKTGGDTKARKHLLWIICGMLACTLVGYFGLQPFMATLKEAAVGGVMDPEARSRFGMLHGVASAFYLIQSVLGGLLVWKLR
ncbi:DUF4149 domain-containing protein [Noviherbaspirillum denitrificans]|uniref:TMEM205-like domain-containing protein n=1 Tax=Noviherbaspirillum denitrificans TaxID=1968433 RepID=A0A254T8G1_9BURK|nr:DUF4149 domain-containing protein [Noviherbaspirillum denitrificans]OWW18940.1 hypothetical protein AYR66_05025 [Noviherbaspirillum denitrificans]